MDISHKSWVLITQPSGDWWPWQDQLRRKSNKSVGNKWDKYRPDSSVPHPRIRESAWKGEGFTASPPTLLNPSNEIWSPYRRSPKKKNTKFAILRLFFLLKTKCFRISKYFGKFTSGFGSWRWTIPGQSGLGISMDEAYESPINSCPAWTTQNRFLHLGSLRCLPKAYFPTKSEHLYGTPLCAKSMIGWKAADLSLQRIGSLIPYKEQGMSAYFSGILNI